MKEFPSDNDAAIVGRLRAALEAHMAPLPSGAPGTGCLDPETLAAWADDGLDARERLAAEAHAAACSRCQALLAALIRTAEPAVAAKSWWPLPTLNWSWRWLVPLTAAAALAVWAIVPSRPGGPPAEVAPTIGGTTPPPISSVDRSSESQAPPPVEHVKEPGGPEKSEVSLASKKTVSAVSPEAAAKVDAAKVPSVALPSDAIAASPSLQGTSAAKQDEPLKGPRTGSPQAAPLGAVQESFARAARQEGSVVEIVSADPRTHWRLVAGGVVQRSTDGGSTWTSQPTGVSATLTAGASPSPDVCWLVGPGGIVLLQTDGRNWRRIPFPEPVDLASIRATDEKTATATAADGRLFSTGDAGRTWTRSPRS